MGFRTFLKGLMVFHICYLWRLVDLYSGYNMEVSDTILLCGFEMTVVAYLLIYVMRRNYFVRVAVPQK